MTKPPKDDHIVYSLLMNLGSQFSAHTIKYVNETKALEGYINDRYCDLNLIFFVYYVEKYSLR